MPRSTIRLFLAIGTRSMLLNIPVRATVEGLAYWSIVSIFCLAKRVVQLNDCDILPAMNGKACRASRVIYRQSLPLREMSCFTYRQDVADPTSATAICLGMVLQSARQ